MLCFTFWAGHSHLYLVSLRQLGAQQATVSTKFGTDRETKIGYCTYQPFCVFCVVFVGWRSVLVCFSCGTPNFSKSMLGVQYPDHLRSEHSFLIYISCLYTQLRPDLRPPVRKNRAIKSFFQLLNMHGTSPRYTRLGLQSPGPCPSHLSEHMIKTLIDVKFCLSEEATLAKLCLKGLPAAPFFVALVLGTLGAVFGAFGAFTTPFAMLMNAPVWGQLSFHASSIYSYPIISISLLVGQAWHLCGCLSMSFADSRKDNSSSPPAQACQTKECQSGALSSNNQVGMPIRSPLQQ